MLHDFAKDKQFGKFDVCIAGAGPAGITLALRLAGKGLRVALLEGGGLAYSEASQALYAVEKQGLDLYAQSTRLRYLGGTSNHWTGRCRPFEAADFSRALPTGLPGWPIAFAEFNRYLPEAMRILDLPAKGFAAHNDNLPDGMFVADRDAQSPPTRFGQKYLPALTASANLHLYLHCNLVDIVFDAAHGRVQQLVVADYAGKRANLVAGHYVLAMGAIENARLLLNSHSLQGAALAANGWVGRGLMEHLNIDLGTFIADEALHGKPLQFFTSEALVQRAGLGRGNISFGQLDKVVSYGRTAAVKTFMKNLACDLDVADKVQFIADFQCPGAGTIGTLLEQFPAARGSRVVLANERDALGLHKARVCWHLAAADQKTIRQLALAMAKSFAAAGLGYVKLHPAMTDTTLPLPVSPHAHHMGTTRMARTAEWGVVDENCRMFGVGNLYIAGSSVFPTGGAGNPTMPLLQLALRLADHLQGLIAT